MEDQSTFQDIILRHLNDPENESLLHEVNRQRSLSAGHEKVFLDIKKLWDLTPLTARLHEVNEVRAIQNLESALGLAKQSKSKKLYRWLSTAAAILFISTMVIWYYVSVTSLTFQIKETHAGVIDSIRLADGSQVFLAENTIIKYPKEFKTENRPVILVKGQAFFKVAKDPKHPFEVTINHSIVKVLGTSFNINYTPNQIQLSVKTGRVMFNANSISVPEILIAGEALSYDLIRNKLSTGNGLNSTSWLTKELHFVDMPLEEVCSELSDYYQVKVVLLARKSIAKKLNANFSNTSIEDVLKVLKETYPIRIQKKEGVFYIKNL